MSNITYCHCRGGNLTSHQIEAHFCQQSPRKSARHNTKNAMQMSFMYLYFCYELEIIERVHQRDGTITSTETPMKSTNTIPLLL